MQWRDAAAASLELQPARLYSGPWSNGKVSTGRRLHAKAEFGNFPGLCQRSAAEPFIRRQHCSQRAAS
jgi:hypothetical protein